MFSRKKPARPARTKPSSRSGSGLSQYGLIDIPNVNNMGMNDVGDDYEDDDAELEAELLALTSGGAPPPRPKPARPVSEASQHLDTMVAESLRDIPSDESLSGDEDDPTLLAELSALQGDEELTEEKQDDSEQDAIKDSDLVTLSGSSVNSAPPVEALLKERLEMYKLAEANAKAANEATRARRFNRGINTLHTLMKQALAGKPINEEDIPPPVAVGGPKSSTPAPAASPEQQTDQPQSPVAQEARDLPPVPARPAPPPVPNRPAPAPPVPPRSVINYGVALPGLVDQNELPSPPKRTPTYKPSSPSEPSETTSTAADEELVPAAEAVAPDSKDNTMVLLIERRDQYKHAAVQAKRSGDTELALTLVKVVKKFDAVISAVNEGKPVDLSAMPPPPPALETTAAQPQPERQRRNSETQESSEPQPPQVEEAVDENEEPVVYVVEIPKTVLEALEQRLAKYKSQEEAAKADNNASKARRMGRIVKQYEDAIKLERVGRPIPVDELPTPPGYPPIPVGGGATSAVPKPVSAPQPSVETVSKQPVPAPTSQSSEPSPKVNVRKMEGSRQEKQLALLVERQKQFKLAALEAKKKGEINQAKEYLRLARGFDPLIEASNCGLPVDMDTVPVLPSASAALESDFDIISADDCSSNSDSDIFERLEKDLIEQLKKFVGTRNHFKAIGDVASANRFEQQALNTKKDLDILRIARKNQSTVPMFHYETRTFSIVQCNTDLGTNDLELTVVQGVNYNVPNPKEVDTYVRFEFPYPSEAPPRDKTPVIYNTNNPIYEERFTLAIQRNRACQRVFKRHGIKFEIWSKGGFFRGDTLIGTVVVKLQMLETKCTLHDSFDIMDGRKTTGGKLEVKLRVRDPILTKQIEQVQEKWLVIDH